jgi:uncharacterized membrane protein YhaH (DUF805 family)
MWCDRQSIFYSNLCALITNQELLNCSINSKVLEMLFAFFCFFFFFVIFYTLAYLMSFLMLTVDRIGDGESPVLMKA